METEQDPSIHNTNAVGSVLERGDLDEVRMILGSRDKVRHIGVIRPGIKVPLASCSAQEKETYTKLLAAGKGFEEIDRAMGGEPPRKSKLRPSNCDYFVCKGEDFRNPADADLIMQRYADRADGKLRRVPVWFPVGEIHLAIPHSFRGFGAGGTIRFSSYYECGQLMCRYVPNGADGKPLPNPQKADYRVRPCPGLDDADTCPDHKAKRCDFGGLYRCNIPGLRGIGEVIVPTTSWYGLAESIASLKRVIGIMGRFGGLFRGAPFLELAKVAEEVRTPDGKRQTQWLPVIQPSVDLMELAAENEPMAVMARAHTALSMLQGKPSGARMPAPGPVAQPQEQVQGGVEEAGAKGEVTPEIEAAMKAIQALCVHPKVNLPWEHVADWIAIEWNVACPEAATIDQLREVHAEIRKRVTAGRLEFVALVADCHRKMEDDLPGFAFDDPGFEEAAGGEA